MTHRHLGRRGIRTGDGQRTPPLPFLKLARLGIERGGDGAGGERRSRSARHRTRRLPRRLPRRFPCHLDRRLVLRGPLLTRRLAITTAPLRLGLFGLSSLGGPVRELLGPPMCLACNVPCALFGRMQRCRSPAPRLQTSIVLSSDPDTILVPSGEKATELMKLLCAFIFSSVTAGQANRHHSRKGDLRARSVDSQHSQGTRIPDFDRLVIRSGHDLRAIW